MNKTDPAGVKLRRRLAEGDPLAKAELLEEFVPRLADQLRKVYRDVEKADPHLIWDAVVDAVLGFANHPQKWDPTQSAMDTYLKMSAEGDLKNALKKKSRRQKREVELSEEGGNKKVEANPEDMALDRLSANDQVKAQILHAFPNAVDQKVLMLMYDKERRTAEYARVLGLSAKPPAEKASAVKNAKDRLKARIRRLGWSLP